MRRLISLLILLVSYNISQAQEIKLKDIPDHHFAEKAVYKLIKLGITSGYPDGTFRGMNNMNRQEIAAYVHNFLKKIKYQEETARLVSELKTEFAAIKYENENPQKPLLSANYKQNIFFGNVGLEGEHGPQTNYRLALSFYEKMGQNGSIKANLDTMDSGFGGATYDLGTQLLDFEGKFKIYDINLTATVGPDYFIHRELIGVNPSDDYTVILRPKPEVTAQTYLQNLYASISYIVHKPNYFGNIETSEATATLSYTYKKLPLIGRTTLSIKPRILWDSFNSDKLCEIGISSSPTKTLTTDLLLGVGGAKTISELYAKAAAKIETQSTKLGLEVNKVGSNYRTPIDKYEFIGLNLFNKFILDGSANIDTYFSHKANKKLIIDAKGTATLTPNFSYGKDYPGTSLTYEFGLNFLASNFSTLRGFYRGYIVPSGISSTDPSFAVSVPEFSSLLGISLSMQI